MLLDVVNWRVGPYTPNVENYIDDVSVKPQNPSLSVTPHEIAASTGGSSTFTLNAGPAYAGKDYVIFSGISGVHPGTSISGVYFPLNFDVWTWTAFSLINTPVMSNFMSTLDANGTATGGFLFPAPEPAATGLPMYFCYVLLNSPGKTPVIYASNPAFILFTP